MDSEVECKEQARWARRELSHSWGGRGVFKVLPLISCKESSVGLGAYRGHCPGPSEETGKEGPAARHGEMWKIMTATPFRLQCPKPASTRTTSPWGQSCKAYVIDFSQASKITPIAFNLQLTPHTSICLPYWIFTSWRHQSWLMFVSPYKVNAQPHARSCRLSEYLFHLSPSTWIQLENYWNRILLLWLSYRSNLRRCIFNKF